MWMPFDAWPMTQLNPQFSHHLLTSWISHKLDPDNVPYIPWLQTDFTEALAWGPDAPLAILNPDLYVAVMDDETLTVVPPDLTPVDVMAL